MLDKHTSCLNFCAKNDPLWTHLSFPKVPEAFDEIQRNRHQRVSEKQAEVSSDVGQESAQIFDEILFVDLGTHLVIERIKFKGAEKKLLQLGFNLL